jgi:hypothetical protein
MALGVIQLPNFRKCSAQKKGPQISGRQGPDGPLLSISSAPLQKCSTFRYDPHAGLFHPSYTAYTSPPVPIVPMDPYLGWKSRTVTSQRPGKPPGACPELASGSCTGPGTRTANPRRS